jgi:hypothetical protein
MRLRMAADGSILLSFELNIPSQKKEEYCPLTLTANPPTLLFGRYKAVYRPQPNHFSAMASLRPSGLLSISGGAAEILSRIDGIHGEAGRCILMAPGKLRAMTQPAWIRPIAFGALILFLLS